MVFCIAIYHLSIPLFAGTFEHGRNVLAAALHEPIRAGAVGGYGGVHRVGGGLPRYAAFHLGYIAAAAITPYAIGLCISKPITGRDGRIGIIPYERPCTTPLTPAVV